MDLERECALFSGQWRGKEVQPTPHPSRIERKRDACGGGAGRRERASERESERARESARERERESARARLHAFLHEPRAATPTFAARCFRSRHLNLIAASVHDKYMVGPSIRPICTRCYFTMTDDSYGPGVQ